MFRKNVHVLPFIFRSFLSASVLFFEQNKLKTEQGIQRFPPAERHLTNQYHRFGPVKASLVGFVVQTPTLYRIPVGAERPRIDVLRLIFTSKKREQVK